MITKDELATATAFAWHRKLTLGLITADEYGQFLEQMDEIIKREKQESEDRKTKEIE